MEPLPPDPLALTGPFPLDDLAPRDMTREQIESVVAHAPKLFQVGGGIPADKGTPAKAVARVSKGTVVKYGTDITLGEGRTMMTVQQQIQISMPEIYDFWISPQQHTDCPGNKPVYIVMQYIPGKVMAEIINDLDKKQTQDLANQLINMLKSLHTIHDTVPGPVGGGRAIAPHLFTSSGAGPFCSVQDLVDWFNQCLELCQCFRRARSQPPFDQDISKDLVMCHMDLHLHNLVVDDSCKLWLIDWNCAGFYPEYFEYVCLKGYAEFLPISMRRAAGKAGKEFLHHVADSMETVEGRRMNAKFNAIGFALKK